MLPKRQTNESGYKLSFEFMEQQHFLRYYPRFHSMSSPLFIRWNKPSFAERRLPTSCIIDASIPANKVSRRHLARPRAAAVRRRSRPLVEGLGLARKCEVESRQARLDVEQQAVGARVEDPVAAVVDAGQAAQGEVERQLRGAGRGDVVRAVVRDEGLQGVGRWSEVALEEEEGAVVGCDVACVGDTCGDRGERAEVEVFFRAVRGKTADVEAAP